MDILQNIIFDFLTNSCVICEKREEKLILCDRCKATTYCSQICLGIDKVNHQKRCQLSRELAYEIQTLLRTLSSQISLSILFLMHEKIKENGSIFIYPYQEGIPIFSGFSSKSLAFYFLPDYQNHNAENISLTIHNPVNGRHARIDFQLGKHLKETLHPEAQMIAEKVIKYLENWEPLKKRWKRDLSLVLETNHPIKICILNKLEHVETYVLNDDNEFRKIFCKECNHTCGEIHEIAKQTVD